MIVKHDEDVVKVAPYLCVCDKCMDNYGSRDLFQEPQIESSEKHFRKPMTRGDFNQSSDEDADELMDEEVDESVNAEYHSQDMVCAVAAGPESLDPFYFIYIEGSYEADFDTMDDFNHSIKAGQQYVSGFYLEKRSQNLKGVTYNVNDKECFLF